MGIYYSKFAVGDTPFCVWDRDLPARNREYLDNIDPDFFVHAAEVHVEVLNRDEGDSSRHAALALRLLHGHALETLLSLLAATVQAPDCVFGWMAKYREPHLQAVLESLSTGRPVLSKLVLDPPTWEGLSAAVHSFVNLEEKEKTIEIEKSYARFWRQAFAAYTNRNNQQEFNGIKHGLRVRSGGFTLRVRREKTLGVPDPEAPVRTLASSKFGSSFLVQETLGSSKRHLTFKQQSVNWHPQALASSIALVRLSLSNVIGFLKVVGGEDAGNVQFSWPADLEDFELARRGAPGVEACSFGPSVRPEDIEFFDSEDILNVYHEAKEVDSGGPQGT